MMLVRRRPNPISVRKTKAVSATPKSVEVNGLSAAFGYDYYNERFFQVVVPDWNLDPLTQTIDTAEAT